MRLLREVAQHQHDALQLSPTHEDRRAGYDGVGPGEPSTPQSQTTEWKTVDPLQETSTHAHSVNAPLA